jgi:hypothetical protein
MSAAPLKQCSLITALAARVPETEEHGENGGEIACAAPEQPVAAPSASSAPQDVPDAAEAFGQCADGHEEEEYDEEEEGEAGGGAAKLAAEEKPLPNKGGEATLEESLMLDELNKEEPGSTSKKRRRLSRRSTEECVERAVSAQ